MEIVGIGTEIVECLRIGRMIEAHGELFLRRIYTDREIRDCRSRKHATEHFACRWAAKEAIFRCLGQSLRRGIAWTDVEVRIEADGKPRVHVRGIAKQRLRGLRIADVLLSIAHCRAYATAQAIAVRGEAPSPPADAS
jgi:holo-[acyl-carrier protein] synthase